MDVSGMGSGTSITSMESRVGNQVSSSAHSKVSAFLQSLSSEKKYSVVRLRQMLARKKNERSKKIQLRRKQKERLRKMVRDLETTEAEIEALNNDILGVEREMEVATDAEEDV